MSNDFKAQLEATIRKFGDDAGTVRSSSSPPISLR